MNWLSSLSEIGLPTIIIVLIGVFGLIKALESFGKWVIEKFKYFYNRKKNSDKLVQDVNNHNDEILLLHSKIDKLIDSINEQSKINDKYDRDMARIIILDMYDKFKQQQYVTLIQKQSYESLYVSYTNKGGNGLIRETIDPYIRSLKVMD